MASWKPIPFGQSNEGHTMKNAVSILLCVATLPIVGLDAAADEPTPPESSLIAALTSEEKEILADLNKTDRAYSERVLTYGHFPNEILDAPSLDFFNGEFGTLKFNADSHTFAVSQVVDEKNLLVWRHKIWLEGMSTKDLTTNSRISTRDIVFQVVGKKDYVTVFGERRTTHHLVAVNRSKVGAVLDEIGENHGFHLFTSREGEQLIFAKFVRLSGTNVVLQRPNEKTVRMRFRDFSEEDKEWIKMQLREGR